MGSCDIRVKGIQKILEEQDRDIIASREIKKSNRKKLAIGLSLVVLAYILSVIVYNLL